MNLTQENWRQRKLQFEYKISYRYLTASKLCNCFYQKEAYQNFNVVCHAATKLWMCCVGTDYALMPGQCRLDKVFVKSCLSFTLPSAVLLIPITLCNLNKHENLGNQFNHSTYYGVSNNPTVWSKCTWQGIFPKLINAQGCHSTLQYWANKRKGQDFSWK